MPKKFQIGTRVLLTLVLAGTILGATSSSADTRDADLIKQGTDALKHHKYDVAVERFSAAIHLAPDDAEAWSMRGEAYADENDHGRGVADCSQALKLAPSSSDAYRRCGNVYFIGENFQEAIENYDTAIKLDPRNFYAFASRGSAYGHLEQDDRAIDDYNRALNLDPSLSSTYASRGNSWLRKGDFDRAWEDFNRAVEADPKNAYAYVSRGYAAASRYAYDDAIADYDQAINVDPSYNDAYRYRDLALEHKSDSRWGYIYLVLIGVGMLALLFAACWTYISPTAFSHGVERHFKRMPDGRLVFYPRMKGAGYVVPDTEKEQGLRLFSRRSRAAALGYGVFGPMLMFVLVLPSMAALTWLQPRIGISSSGAIFVASFGCVSVVLAGGLMAFSRWRRAAVCGLVEAAEQGEPPTLDQWNDDLVLDTPAVVRWIALAVILFVSFQSVKGLWRVRHDLSLSRLERMSWFGWVCIAGYLFTLWYCGKLLIYATRVRGRRAGQAEKSA